MKTSMKKNKNVAGQTHSDSPSSKLDRETIATCAYLIWEQEGRPDGKQEVHWLQAETRLRQSDAAKK